MLALQAGLARGVDKLSIGSMRLVELIKKQASLILWNEKSKREKDR